MYLFTGACVNWARRKWCVGSSSMIILSLLLGCSPYSKEYVEGSKHMALGDDDAAIYEFNRAIQNNPKEALSYYSRGVIYSQKDQYDEAIADFDKVLELNQQYASSNLTTTPRPSNTSSAASDFFNIAEMDRSAKMGVGSPTGYAGTPGVIVPGGPSKQTNWKEYTEKLITRTALQLRAVTSRKKAESLEAAGRIPQALTAYSDYIAFYHRLTPKQQQQQYVAEVYKYSLQKIDALKLNQK